MTTVAATDLVEQPSRSSSKVSRTYLGYELLRTFRNRRFLVFSLAFPLVMFFLIAAPNRNQKLGGIPFAAYYMAGMLTWGGMSAVIAGGARIAQERSVGWHRQLRITPLSSRTYFASKILSGYALASVTIVLLYAAGMSVGVRLTVGEWLELTGYALVALIPFAVLGVILGHLLTVDSMGPALGGVSALFAILGGAWGPVAQTGLFHHIAELLPSYWLVWAGHVVVGGSAWPVRAWVVIGVWSLVLARIAVRVYLRDTQRV